jgi:hypothetical protein
VTAHYSDDSEEVVTDYSAAPAAGTVLDAAGQQAVTVSYTEDGVTVTVTFNVTVKTISVEKVLESISITTNPDKTEYTVGDALDLTGLVVTAHYSDDSEEVVADYSTAPVAGAILEIAGQQTVAVNYTEDGKTVAVTFSVTVKTISVEKTLDSISATTYPDKMEYTEGEALDLTGLVVTACYSDGSKEAVTGYSTTPEAGTVLDTAGEYDIIVSYTEDGKTVTTKFSVTVEMVDIVTVLDSISVTEYPDKREYDLGEALDLAGLVITAHYSDKSTSPVTGYTTAPAAGTILNTAGSQTITVSYTEDGKEVTTSFTITVKPALPVYKISLDTTGHTFPSATAGYGAQTARTVTVANDGNQPTGPLTINIIGSATSPAPNAFVLSGATISGINPDGSETFTVRPATGLVAGTYSATLTVSGGNGITASMTLRFTVNPASTDGGGSSGGGGGSDSGSSPSQTPTPPTTVVIPEEETPLSGPAGSFVNPFEDVFEGNWFYYDALYAYNKGLMFGTSTDPMLFSPGMNLTRGMIVTILYRMSGSPNVNGLPNPFGDVASGNWFTDAVRWAAANGIVLGYGDGSFGPNDHVTREQLAVILYHYAGYSGVMLPGLRSYADFSDSQSIADYAAEAVALLYMAEIISGKEGHSFDPKGFATRAEVSAILVRFIEAAEQKQAQRPELVPEQESDQDQEEDEDDDEKEEDEEPEQDQEKE